MRRILEHNAVQVSLIALILGTALLCIFTPDVFLLKRGANFAVQIMLAMLFASFLFMVLNQRRLMFTSLFATALLSFYLKSTSDQSIRFPNVNKQPQISVAHIDLSLSDDYTETMHTIWSTDVDVISFQEYTPDWHNYLKNELSDRYPYRSSMTRIDPYGMALYSKLPVTNFDTLLLSDLDEIPCLHATLRVDRETDIHLISAHTVPPVNSLAYERIREQFKMISDYLDGLTGPVITLGDFSLPSWSEEIKDFKFRNKLVDSRRDIVPPAVNKPVLMFKIPIDHIFYSKEIECTAFNVIDGKSTNHLGILGKYQLKDLASLEAPAIR